MERKKRDGIFMLKYKKLTRKWDRDNKNEKKKTIKRKTVKKKRKKEENTRKKKGKRVYLTAGQMDGRMGGVIKKFL